jgi:hypothetical protein
LASSPGRMRRTLVWISREEMVDFLLYAASSARARSATQQQIAAVNLIDRRTGSFGGNALKDVVDERVEDGHGFV